METNKRKNSRKKQTNIFRKSARKEINKLNNVHETNNSLNQKLLDNIESSSSLSDSNDDKKNNNKDDFRNNIKNEGPLALKYKFKSKKNIFYNELKLNSSKNNELMKNNSNENIEKSNSETGENIEIKIYYEGKSLLLIINKDDTLKNLLNKISAKLSPYYKLEYYDIIYKLQIIDIIKFKDEKIKEIIKNDNTNEIPSFLLLKKKSDNNESKGTTVKIENFPSFTDLSVVLTEFFQNESIESNFSINYSTNLCKILFSNTEKAISLVTFLNKLKQKNPIYKRLRVKLDYKMKINLKNIKSKQKELKLILPTIDQKFISNIQKNKFLIKNSMNTPPKRRKDLEFIFPDISTEKKSKISKTIEIEKNTLQKSENEISNAKLYFSCKKLTEKTQPKDLMKLNEEDPKKHSLNLLNLYNNNKRNSNRKIILTRNSVLINHAPTVKISSDKKTRNSFSKKGISIPGLDLNIYEEKNTQKRKSNENGSINMRQKTEIDTIVNDEYVENDPFILAAKKQKIFSSNRKSFIEVLHNDIFKPKNINNFKDKKKLKVHFRPSQNKKKGK